MSHSADWRMLESNYFSEYIKFRTVVKSGSVDDYQNVAIHFANFVDSYENVLFTCEDVLQSLSDCDPHDERDELIDLINTARSSFNELKQCYSMYKKCNGTSSEHHAVKPCDQTSHTSSFSFRCNTHEQLKRKADFEVEKLKKEMDQIDLQFNLVIDEQIINEQMLRKLEKECVDEEFVNMKREERSSVEKLARN